MIVNPDSPLTFLQQRLGYVAAHPDRSWTLLVDNVPVWPGDQVPDVSAAPADALVYAPCAGSEELLDAITGRTLSRWGRRVPPGSLLVTNGAMHALTLLARHFAAPGRVALVQRPVLAAIPKVLRDSGFRVVFFDADDESIGALTFPGDTALIYLNSPNNPTGNVVSRAALAAIADRALTCGATVVCDQAYDDFGTPESDAATAEILTRATTSEHIFYVNSMSKNFGAPGLRIGWIIGHRAVVAQLAGRLERETVAVSGLSQTVAAAALRRGNEVLRQVVRDSRTQWLDALADQGLRPDSTGQAGTSLVLRVPVPDIERFADALMVHDNLAVTTSANFEGVAPGDRSWMRLPLGGATHDIAPAAAVLARALQRAGTDASGAERAYR